MSIEALVLAVQRARPDVRSVGIYKHPITDDQWMAEAAYGESPANGGIEFAISLTLEEALIKLASKLSAKSPEGA